jgi:transposase InsO family protein
MNTYMNDTQLTGLDEVDQFLTSSDKIEFKPLRLEERYRWIAATLKRLNYFRLNRQDKGVVREYLMKMTHYSHSQLTRLITQYKEHHWIGRRHRERHCFPKKYTREDILLLAKMDEWHETLSGPATKKLCERAYKIFGDEQYQRLAVISVSHLYNLRSSKIYLQKRRHFTKTQRTKVPIGERRKPTPQGQPGYLRIDTVHQGDQDGEKGVYHINAVDEVTQMEVISAVEKISEQRLIPVLERILESFPFVIKELHSDNGCEYVNQYVVQLLQKLLIELTKSRARHSNDNALVEGKNGSIIRKHLGYIHIPQRWAPEINQFYQRHFIPYINYHRPCYFALTVTDSKGKEKKKYPYQQMMTPYEKLKSLPQAECYLKPGVTFKGLDALAYQENDLTAAQKMKQARDQLLKQILKLGTVKKDTAHPVLKLLQNRVVETSSQGE